MVDSCLILRSARPFMITIGLGLITVISFVIPGLDHAWQLDWSNGFTDSTLWQLITCHFAHWTMEHLFWDSVAFLVLGGIAERRNRSTYVATLILSAVMIPVVTIAVAQEVTSYRGLSGIDSALFVLVAVNVILDAWRDRNLKFVGLGMTGVLLFLAKTLFEFQAESTLFVSNSSFQPLPIAHLIGAVSALCVTLVFGVRRDQSLVLESDENQKPAISA